jgi:hypothetical protein
MALGVSTNSGSCAASRGRLLVARPFSRRLTREEHYCRIQHEGTAAHSAARMPGNKSRKPGGGGTLGA